MTVPYFTYLQTLMFFSKPIKWQTTDGTTSAEDVTLNLRQKKKKKAGLLKPLADDWWRNVLVIGRPFAKGLDINHQWPVSKGWGGGAKCNGTVASGVRLDSCSRFEASSPEIQKQRRPHKV